MIAGIYILLKSSLKQCWKHVLSLLRLRLRQLAIKFCIVRTAISWLLLMLLIFIPHLAGRFLAAIGRADDFFCSLNPSSTLLFLYIPQTLLSLLTVISAHLSPICSFNPFHRPCPLSQQSLLHMKPPFCSFYAFHIHCFHS